MEMDAGWERIHDLCSFILLDMKGKVLLRLRALYLPTLRAESTREEWGTRVFAVKRKDMLPAKHKVLLRSR